MLYHYVKRYLKNKYQQAHGDVVWKPLDDIQFFNHIEKRYSHEDFVKELSEVKEAFRDFFEPVGKIVFRYKEKSGIQFKIFPYIVEPKHSKHLKKIIEIILQNKKYILYPYKGQNDQIAITGKIRRDINRELFHTQESVNTKELIKYAIREALQLSKRDVIIQLKRKYIVKIFEKNSVLHVDVAVPSKREGIANRYNGYTPEEIIESYNTIFVRGDGKITHFLQQTMHNLFQTKLNFRTISNKFYEEQALKIIHTAIEDELSNYGSFEKDYRLGIAGYLMRKHFQEIHELMARELITAIYEKDTNANDFLLYYNGDIVLRNNEKYKIPSIKTEDGRQWNNASLIGICNLWMHAKKKKEKLEQRLSKTEVKLQQLEAKLEDIQPEIQKQDKIIIKVEKQLEIAEKPYKEFQKKLNYLKRTNLDSDEYFVVLSQFTSAEKDVEDLKKTIAEATKKIADIKKVNRITYTEFDFYTAEKKQLLDDIKAQNLNIDSKSSQIDPILRSLSKVLMQRTKKMH